MTTTAEAHATRRDFLYIATGAVAAAGAAATVWPLISQMNPDASTIAAGAPIEVDLAPIAEGQSIKVFWRGKPIFVRHRTPEGNRGSRRTCQLSSLRDPQADSARVKQGHAELAGRLRQLHPSRLHPARQPGRTMAAGSARATARCSIRRAASGRAPLRPTFQFPLTPSSPTPRSRSADSRPASMNVARNFLS